MNPQDSVKFTDQITSYKKSRGKLDNDQLHLSKSILNESFNFIPCQEICK